MTTRDRSSAFAVHCYRYLIRLYPRWFRDLYGHQMEEDFIELNRRNHGSPVGVRVKMWSTVLRDLAISIPREWLSAIRRRRGMVPKDQRLPRGEYMSSLFSDLRYAFRMLRLHPAFSAMVIATLALGIGANVAMFSVVDAVLLSELPYPNADRLVMVWNRHTNTGADKVQISGLDLVDYRTQTTSFDDFAYMHNAMDNALSDGGPSEQVDVGYVSVNFFEIFGRGPRVGRTFTAADANASGSLRGAAPAIISHGLWARRYGSDPNVIGRTVLVGGVPSEIIGVAPEGFELLLPYAGDGAIAGGTNDFIDLFRILPEGMLTNFPRSLAIFRVLGRLRPGVTVGQAQEEMDALAERLRQEHRVHSERRTAIDLVPMHAEVVGGLKAIVWSLFGAVGFVLLIACANVANLTLVRAANRKREVAVRVALGAQRGRLLRQLLAENTLLAVAGAVLGLVVARAALGGIVGLAPADVPMLDDVDVNVRATAFAAGVTVLAMVLFGLWPALRGTRVAPLTHLSEGPRSGLGRGHRLRTAIVSGEIALSLVLLIGGGLLIRSFMLMQNARLGFEPTSAITAKMALPHGTYDDESLRANYWNSLRREVAALPGVEAAGLVSPLPFAGQGGEVPYGQTGGDSEDWGRYVASLASASPGYFEAMNATLVDGRTFTDADFSGDTRVAVVDEILAQRLYPGGNAVGRALWIQPMGSGEREALEIVGVVSHIRHTSMAGPEREVIYRPNNRSYRMWLVVRTAGNPVAVLPDLRRLAASLDTDVPLFDERTFEEYLGGEIAPTRFTMTLANVFAMIALIMAAVGLYGVISYSVTQRWSELGVRVALGAHDADIIRLVLLHGAKVAGVGIVLGLIVSLVVSRAIRSLLVGVAPTDLTTFVGVSLLLAIVALAASYVPARRAAKLDPVVALRTE